MGTLVLTATTANGSRTATLTIPDAALARVLNSHNSGGKTNAQVFDDIANSFFQRLGAETLSSEAAAAAAAATPTPLAVPNAAPTGTAP